ncbi:solute carrier family 22 member 4 isoform X2 [Hydra vulgaris]|uniref:Solute carrier family 22 member 4 isoform X2 n=1 Tax=Hydra vulgaris TaxID=6087 RepID=A0ABM4BQJ0_HYDVU
MSFADEQIVNFDKNEKQEAKSLINQQNENSDETNKEEKKDFEKLDVDGILFLIGEFGRSQILLMIMLSLLMIPTAYQSLSITFIGLNPPWRCTNNSKECNRQGEFSINDEFYKQRCSMKRDSWTYVTEKDFSIVTEWDLVCEKVSLTYMANSALQIGGGIGTIILGFMSDSYGRKKILYPTFVLFIVISFLIAFIQTFWIFFALRIIVGILQGGIYLTLWVLMTESVGLTYRSYSNVLWCAYTVGMCLMALQSWLVPKWRILLILLSAPYLILVGTYSFMPESARWLRVKNQISLAEKVLKQIAKCNKKPWPNACLSAISENSKQKKTSYIYVFYPLKVFLSTSMQFFLWFGNAVAYYGISLISENLSNNMYRDFILISIVDIPSNFIVCWLCNRFGRKKTTIITAVIGGALVIVLAFIPCRADYYFVRVSVAMVAKFFVNLSYGGIYIWSTELYPTSIRSQGIGVCTWAGVLGAASAPWVSQFLGYIHLALPFCVMGSILFISGVCCCILPETNGISTVEVVEE